MKENIHPKYNVITVDCSCGTTFQVGSTLEDNLHLEVCSDCHPFFTGKQRIVDTTGRVDSFNRRFGISKSDGAQAGS